MSPPDAAMETPRRRRPIAVSLPPGGVFVLESHHAPGFRMAPERHDFLEVFYVVAGAGSFHIEGRRHACSRGDVVVVPPGQAHHIEDQPAAPLTLYGVCVSPAVLNAEPGLLNLLRPGCL